MKLNYKFLLLFLIVLLNSCKRLYETHSEINPHTAEAEKIDKPESIPNNLNLPDSKISFTAELSGITDGDTADILYGKLPLRIRLQHIDAPEKRGNQPYGNEAKTILAELCFGEQITIVTDGEFDMGGRLIAENYNAEGVNVNKEMVRLGYAWHFKKYSDNLSYDALEKEARKLKRGLWQENNPMAPWDFR